jgi:hypothetical protein
MGTSSFALYPVTVFVVDICIPLTTPFSITLTLFVNVRTKFHTHKEHRQKKNIVEELKIQWGLILTMFIAMSMHFLDSFAGLTRTEFSVFGVMRRVLLLSDKLTRDLSQIVVQLRSWCS